MNICGDPKLGNKIWELGVSHDLPPLTYEQVVCFFLVGKGKMDSKHDLNIWGPGE